MQYHSYVEDLELLVHTECGDIYGDNIDYIGLLCISASGGHGTCSVSSFLIISSLLICVLIQLCFQFRVTLADP